jgi:hypothetical protein
VWGEWGNVLHGCDMRRRRPQRSGGERRRRALAPPIMVYASRAATLPHPAHSTGHAGGCWQVCQASDIPGMAGGLQDKAVQGLLCSSRHPQPTPRTSAGGCGDRLWQLSWGGLKGDAGNNGRFQGWGSRCPQHGVAALAGTRIVL